MKKTLSSANLKQELWETLLKVKNKKLNPIIANAVAKQSREIMTVIRAEMQMAAAIGEKPSKKLLGQKTEKVIK